MLKSQAALSVAHQQNRSLVAPAPRIRSQCHDNVDPDAQTHAHSDPVALTYRAASD
jgi:hypothetical protein